MGSCSNLDATDTSLEMSVVLSTLSSAQVGQTQPTLKKLHTFSFIGFHFGFGVTFKPEFNREVLMSLNYEVARVG